MKINYDKEADTFDITLKKGKVDRTIEIAPEVFVDLNKEGVPLYLEIIGVSEKFGKKNFSDVVIGGKTIRLPITV